MSAYYLNNLGSALVIPPLQTIESQMSIVCDEWGISYLNISLCDVDAIGDRLKTEKPRIILASVEKISDHAVQKQLSVVKFDYIAVDEAQV